ncbi:MAG: Arm DNA-binding domain-containing protein [Adhaeribacter sp.]
MWSNRFSLLFFLKKPKNYNGGKQPIYMRITIDAARTDLSTQRECAPERRNSRGGRASGTKEEVRMTSPPQKKPSHFKVEKSGNFN